ncbi:hydrolase 2, exosortase A system-associated [Caenispirillum bisanense]|uniref:hydrolase 2, exosortase A system-associated n=1 Tax=Caenispirillum bisanense TaxID=414052 RepID=UPI0031E26489
MASPRLHPAFIDGPQGRLFTVLHAAERPLWSVLWLPPFGEEMNRSRRMATLLGHALAAEGGALLVLDPSGTGDSAGRFEDATWDGWRADAHAALEWLRAEGLAPRAAGGLRTGAVLALDLAVEAQLAHAVMWQPVTRGDLFLTQLLRVRVAAGLGDGRGETVKDLRARLAGGETVEVAGYPLTPAMASALEAISVKDMGAGYRGTIDLLQVSADPHAPAPQGIGALVDGWLRRRVEATLRQVAGEPFWTIEETTLAPALVAATVDVLMGGRAPAGVLAAATGFGGVRAGEAAP